MKELIRVLVIILVPSFVASNLVGCGGDEAGVGTPAAEVKWGGDREVEAVPSEPWPDVEAVPSEPWPDVEAVPSEPWPDEGAVPSEPPPDEE